MSEKKIELPAWEIEEIKLFQTEAKNYLDLHVRQLVGVINGIQEQLKPHIQETVSSIANISSILATQMRGMDTSWIVALSDEYTKWWGDVIDPLLATIKKSEQELPEATKKGFALLAEKGWYFDYDLDYSTLWALKNAIESNEIDAVDDFMREHYSSHLQEIETNVCKKNPNRYKYVHSAFEAHKRCEYELSIPVILIQADGIGFDKLNKSIFISKERQDIKDLIMGKLMSDLRKTLFAPFIEESPINISKSKRESTFNQLNRHSVIHGESLDYESEMNSLKAISFLNYIANVLNQTDYC